MLNPFSKEAQLSRSPGGNRKSKEAKSAKEKGTQLEKTVQEAFQKSSKAKVRRHNQAGDGGGLGRPDVAIQYGWHCEVKNEERITLREYIKQLKEDCPKGHKPALVLGIDGTPWIMIRLEDRLNFAADQVEAAGGEVSFGN